MAVSAIIWDCVPFRWKTAAGSPVSSGQHPFDLILSCDVSSYFNEPYQEKNSSPGAVLKLLTIQRLIDVCKYSNLLLLACIASIALNIAPIAGYLLLIPSLALSLLYWTGYVQTQKAQKRTKERWRWHSVTSIIFFGCP